MPALARCFVPLLCLAMFGAPAARADLTQFGLAKVDITPAEPVRLSGYGNRDKPSEGVAQRLWARAVVFQAEGGKPHALVAVDTIGFPGALTTRIARRLEQQHGITRERFVACGTHSHCAPHLPEGLVNIFSTPLTPAEGEAGRRYTQLVEDKVVEVIGTALENLTPGRLLLATGKVGFAMNRRVLSGGHWTKFGETPGAPVDHALPVLKIVGPDGKLRGVVFNYACHCTTLGGNFNRVCGDWAGFAQEDLEERNPGIVALCTIGCGADANPSPRGELEMAQAHGRAVALEVQRVIEGPLGEIKGAPVASFGYAGLASVRPTLDELRARLDLENLQARRHAENMLALHQKMGRLPETYPMPVQTWKFGDALTMVFLGGEVVVDYAHRLRREIDSKNVWVTAYANDVFGYVASERVRQEGGYEVDRSMVYYNQPGPWEPGTEDLVIRRVHEVVANPMSEGALSVDEALESFRLTEGFEIEVVAAEPLVTDPISFAFGADGRLWVVEMGDYPRGLDGSERPGGRVKFLEDDNGDGRFDRATVFLDGLSYPTGVFPWRDGVLVSAAPDILFAADRDGDSRAEVREVLFTGFAEANPQHRLNGFTYGLDNWLYVASGDDGREVKSLRTGEVVSISGRDLRIRPESGRAEPISGHTQFGLNRDDWGNWFGGNNSRPIFHYAIDDRYLRRNPHVPAPRSIVDLIEPAFAPPVFPASRTVDRFNDLFAANRFTSACSPHIFRDESLGEAVQGAAFISEPVHNLVNRTLLVEQGVTYRGERHPAEQSSEFLASTDVWFRPAKVATGPDGALWVADMYRQVIEHPQWIPLDWQQRLDLRAGADRGRIYRVYRTGHRPEPVPRPATFSSAELVAELAHPNGPRRDLAQQLLVERQDLSAVPLLEETARTFPEPRARLHALWTLEGLGRLAPELLVHALDDPDGRVQRQAVRLAETRLNAHSQLAGKVASLVDHPQLRVRYQVALALGEWDSPHAAEGLSALLLKDLDDTWMRTAVISSAARHARGMLPGVMHQAGTSITAADLLEQLVTTALGHDRSDDAVQAILAGIVSETPVDDWQFAALGSALDALERGGIGFTELRRRDDPGLRETVATVEAMMHQAREWVFDETVPAAGRVAAMRILARGDEQGDADRRALAGLLQPRQPLAVQHAAVESLVHTRADEVPQLLIANWRRLTPATQQAVVEALLSRPAWTAALLDALDAEHISRGDLEASARNRLLGSRSRAVRDRAAKLFDSAGGGNREEVVQQFVHVLDVPGNPFRGARVFVRRCANCHQFRGQGREVGPKLESLQDRSGTVLLTAMLDPNRAVEAKYRNYVAATLDGRVHDGMIIEESANSVTLARPNGDRAVLLRTDIEEFTNSGKSFMPEGLEKDLTGQDLADVIAFVQSGTQAVAGDVTDAGSGTTALWQTRRRWLKDAGVTFEESVVAGGTRRETSHWLGRGTVVCTPEANAVSGLRWTSTSSSAAPSQAAEPVVYRVPVALYGSPAADVTFEFRLAGRPQVELPLTHADGAWTGSDGRVTLRYLAVESGEMHSSGLLDVEVDPSHGAPAGRLEFEIRSMPETADAWLGIIVSN